LIILVVDPWPAGGPGSVVGPRHSHARPNPPLNIGVAQSVANLGGFSATLVVLAAMGAVHDLRRRF